MTPELVVVGVVSEAASVREELVRAIEAAGASAVARTEATAIASGAAVDVIVFDVGAAPERFVPAALMLADDARTRDVPRVLIVAGDTPVERIAPFGAAVVVSSASAADKLPGVLVAAVAQVHARNEMARSLEKLTADRRATEQRLTALGDEAGTLSHDSRVLFGVVLGYAGNLRDGIAGPLSEVQRGHVMNIIEASTDAVALLDRHLLSLRRTVRESRGSDAAPDLATRQPPRRRQTDLGELVRTTVVLLGGVAAAKQIRLTADVAAALPDAWCDAMQIKQALVNLLSNALKFTPASGTVEVVLRRGAAAPSRPRPEIELVVSDTGAGIPHAERERVFERGVRLDRDRLTPGSGIGLAVVRAVVEQHGGTVRIDDAPGGGASFVLSLPSDPRARASDGPRLVTAFSAEDSE